jgi:protein MBA1
MANSTRCATGTFVIPPLAQFPKPLGQKLRFLGWWLVIKGQEILTNAALKFTSKPTIFKAAKFKPKRSVIIPTVKALHRSMAEALAAGDKNTINKICSRKLAGPLLASIDARPRGRRYGWELVKYTNKLFYPAIRSHRVSPLSRERHAPIIRQAIVAISSRQRRVQYDAQGQVVPGSEKEIDVVENVAIACIVDPRTWQQGEWRLLGTIKPTTYEGWAEEKELLKNMLRQS